ncbi:MAG: transcriptional repressor of photosystem genes PpsR [Rhodobacteraceae bacterium HLUCCA08]|nr:MAG: transcriptional repressor of photosystem genes PpsR [Rhodobacteraceae bacterium HLUCCA08]
MTSRGAKYWSSGAIPLIAPEILGNIISEIADVSVVIAEDGRILALMLNPTSTDYDALQNAEGRDIRAFLTTESIRKFDDRLGEFLSATGPVRPLELNHSRSEGRADLPVRYSFHRIGPDGAILMLGRDLRPIAEMQQQLVQAQLSLERDYEVQREYDTRFRVLLEGTRDAVVFVSLGTGLMTEVNSVAARIFSRGRNDLVGTALADRFDKRRRAGLIEALLVQALAEKPASLTLALPDGTTEVRLHPTLFRSAGERVLMCRIEPVGDGQAAADALTRNLYGLFEQGPDGVVFTDEAGQILSLNDAFLDLIEAAHDVKVRGRNLSDFLQRGAVDLKVLTENALRTGRMRAYSTKLQGDFSSPRAAEVAITAIRAGDHTAFAFVFRDLSRVEAQRPSITPVTDDSVRSLMELVGSATLKEIVAETTNAVERMCIETAVELTMNNRVAAAEMLGLSRQSLYVKLRKYGLLKRDDDSG